MAKDSEKVDAFMPWWIGDYLADTTHLTCEQHGAYLLLIACYWRNGGPLDADEKRLAATCRMTSGQWKRNRETVLAFFKADAGKMHHKRIDEELASAKARKTAAQRSANARWDKLRNGCETDANALRPECSSTPSSTDFVFVPPNPPDDSAEAYPGGFLEFLTDYPRKDMPEKARTVWDKHDTGPQFRRDCRAGLAKWKAFEGWHTHSGKFIPHAATWLANRQWTVEPPKDDDTKKGTVKNGRSGNRGSNAEYRQPGDDPLAGRREYTEADAERERLEREAATVTQF